MMQGDPFFLIGRSLDPTGTGEVIRIRIVGLAVGLLDEILQLVLVGVGRDAAERRTGAPGYDQAALGPRLLQLFLVLL